MTDPIAPPSAPDELVVDQEPAPPVPHLGGGGDGDEGTADPGGDSDPSEAAGADPDAPGQ
jgi:hypothetical protein